MSSRVVRRMIENGGESGGIDRDRVGRRQQQRVDGGAGGGARGTSSYRPTRGRGFGNRNAGVGAGAGGGDAGDRRAERRRGGTSLFQRMTGALHATGTFLWNNAGFAPLLLYFAWVPFIVVSQGGWLSMPTALFGGEGLLGIIRWFRWAIPFVFNLWPYFSDFIVSSTLWVLGVPMLTLATIMFARNFAEVRSIARALARRASRVTPSEATAAAARAMADLARFPATLAESLGKALVPGGWMHSAVSVATAEIVSYPAALVAGLAVAVRRLALQAAALDAKGFYADVVREFTEFPSLLASSVGLRQGAGFFKDFAPLGDVIAELFIGPAPLKGHRVPDLAAFVRAGGGGGGRFGGGGFEDEYDFGANVGGVLDGRGGRRGSRAVSTLGLGGLPSIVGVPGGRLARVDENAQLAEGGRGSFRFRGGGGSGWVRGGGAAAAAGEVDDLDLDGGGGGGGGGGDAEGGGFGRARESV